MKRVYLSLFLLLSMLLQANAQKENNVWIFGHNGGLDFNGIAPSSITSSMSTESGCASVASQSGALKFYTNGQSVWNSNHVTMPNGTGLLGNSANDTYYGQGALIVPFVNDTSKFYVFSLNGNYDSDGLDSLYYSVVDMSLNNGLGDVVASQKNIWLGDGMGSAMQAVAGEDCNIWVLTHLRDTNVFEAFEITASGVNPAPVTSTIGSYSGTYAYRTAMLSISPKRDKIVVGNFSISTGFNIIKPVASAVELYDFNASNGTVSNVVVIDATLVGWLNFLGVCFSPDGTKLYATNPFNPFAGLAGVVQYDLSLGNLKTEVGFVPFCSDLRIGPDNKIYVTCGLGGGFTLDVIENPNVAGTGCNYNAGAITLLSGTTVTSALPSAVVYPIKDTTYTSYNVNICNGGNLKLHAPNGFFYYYYQGLAVTDTVFTVGSEGTYCVIYEDYCRYLVDTYHVSLYNLSSDLKDTALCGNEFEYPLDASASNTPGTQYRWQDNSAGPLFTATSPGTYWVEMELEGCRKTDTITLKGKPIPTFSLGNDTSICNGDMLKLEVPRYADVYQWQNGSNKKSIEARDPGNYSVAITLDGCLAYDTLQLKTENCNCIAMIPNAFTPNGDGVNDQFVPIIKCANLIPDFHISIYNRFGQRIYYTDKQGDGWDGTYNGRPSEVDTYYYILEYSTRINKETSVRKGDITLVR